MPILPCRQTDHDGKNRRTAELIGELAESVTESRLRALHPVLLLPSSVLHPRFLPRRRTRTTKVEKILVLKKRASSIHVVDREPIAVADAPARKPTHRRRTRRGLGEHGTKQDVPKSMMIQNSVRHLDYAKREVIVVRYYDIRANDVEAVAHGLEAEP